ncbi:MAG: hypothetical protein HQK54_00700 [Oligoflexales bacterium]|nr:hypothetical protein [Oligoflexales bacterium]
MKNSIYFFLMLLLTLLLIGCSEGGNLNKMFYSKGDKKAIDYLLKEGEKKYDEGNYVESQQIAAEVLDFNPNNEKAAVLLGYSYLALAGLETFNIASKLIDVSNADKTTAKLRGEDYELLATSTETSATLEKYQSLIVNADDLENLKGVTKTLEGVELRLPKTAPEARSVSQTLININNAIKSICPFVQDGAKLTGEVVDDRHSAANCPPATITKKLSAKSNFLFALAHLGEAIAFNAVMLPIMTNIDKVITNLGQKTGRDIDTIKSYVKSISSVNEVLNIVLPTTGTDEKNSMLTALFNDMETIGKSFATIPGIPQEVTKTINNALSTLRAKKDELAKKAKSSSGSSSPENSGAKAIKEQLTSTMGESIQKQITPDMQKTLNQPENKATKTELCAAYKDITSTTYSFCTN